jgi:carboxypeptidase family protein
MSNNSDGGCSMDRWYLVCRAAFTIGLVLWCAAVAPAQQADPRDVQVAPRDRMPPPRTGTGAIRGRVVDGVTGTGVPRARVVLQGGVRPTIVTDASGAFAFGNLPAGAMMISVDKSTYLSTRFPAPGRTVRTGSRPLILADGQVLDNVTIPLFHGAAIAGRVLDANGDPLDIAQVSVLRVPGAGRVGRPMARGGSSTDDRGEFRVGRLEPGTYLVQVTARRNQMPEETMPGGSPAPPLPQPLPTYYPGALSIDQAQPITLERGQTATDIDIVLAEGFPGIVNGTVTLANGASIAGSNTYINARRISNEVAGDFHGGFNVGTGVRPDGTFKLILPPGEYQLDARVTPRTSGSIRPEDIQFGALKLTVVSGAEDSVAIVAGRGASATGRIVFEGTTPPPPSPGKAHIPMFSENGQCQHGEATIAADWSFRVDGLNGTCSVQPIATFGRWMLKAVIVNGENVADAPVTFEAGQQLRNVQVVVTDRRSELSFRVSDDSGQVTREYVVIAYPVEKTRWSTAHIMVGQTIDPVLLARSGSSTSAVPGSPQRAAPVRREVMSGLGPGDYYVVAVDDLEPEDYRDTAVLDRLRSSGTRVTIAEGSNSEVVLRRVSFADVMARR